MFVSVVTSKNRTHIAGTIATDLVIITLYHTGNLKSRKPSMTNCPAYVPVIVELYPAASRPMAQMYLLAFPNVSLRASAADSKSSSPAPGFLIE